MANLRHTALAALLSVLLLAGPAAARERDGAERNRLPAFVTGPVRGAVYDGAADDLLTAGLGMSGLASPVPPGFADVAAPTAAELRRRAIYQNYRALVDMTPGGGFGTFYGPNLDAQGRPTRGEGKVAGEEWLAYADDGSGRQNVTLVVQLPASFDPAHPCIVSATSSGSRGVYGAIATAGEWGLKRGCAVAYVDKGTGNGAHDLETDTVGLIDGTRAAASAAGARSSFTAPLDTASRAAFAAANPWRWAWKHAHSTLNPEKDWGRDTLRAIRFALWAVNERHGRLAADGRTRLRTIDPGNTLVIASSVSNGGGAALAAAEQDEAGLIDGVVAGEPQVQIEHEEGLRVLRGGRPVGSFGRGLYDYTTVANLLQPCASLATPGAPGAAFVPAALASARCAALAEAGQVSGATTSEQAADALARLHAAGWEPESDALHASHYAFATTAIAVTYASSYGRFGVEESPCGFSYAATSAAGAPVALAPASALLLFGDGNGIPPTGGINLVNDRSVGGPRRDALSVSPGDRLDFNAPGALCLRRLFTGRDEAGAPLTGQELQNAIRVRLGAREVQREADTHRTPTILVQGRADALVPVNHASRAYLAAASRRHGRGPVRYYEVENAQHFDAFVGNALLPGYATRFVPLHVYFVRAMDLMYDHLRSSTPLPDSQVIRTTPRALVGGAVEPLGPGNVPPIAAAPAEANRITASRGTVNVPD